METDTLVLHYSGKAETNIAFMDYCSINDMILHQIQINGDFSMRAKFYINGVLRAILTHGFGVSLVDINHDIKMGDRLIFIPCDAIPHPSHIYTRITLIAQIMKQPDDELTPAVI
jgi:hypothetical protein